MKFSTKALRLFAPLLALFLFYPQPSHAAAAEVTSPEASYNPVADPAAVVTIGHARFTVLTPQLIRMEWAADGKFEDHPSFVFLNRRLPVPAFKQKHDGPQLTLTTSALKLSYNAATADDGRFSPTNLTINFSLGGKLVIWHPGTPDTGNLQGTARTLDGARGDKLRAPMDPGLVSRDGWVLVDDSTRPLFDSDNFAFTHGENSPWPWVMERPSGDRQDWYFFGYGHDYKQALHDFTRVAGRIPLPPRFAFGIWWSRYWSYSDQGLDDLVRGFRENSTPLNVLVIDMGWHISREQLEAMHETDKSGERLGWTGYTWNHLLFPDPKAFLTGIHQQGLKATLNLHPASGIQPWEQQYPAMARAMGIDPATKKYVPFDPTNKKWAENYFKLVLHPLEQQGINFWWLDWQQEPNTKLPGVNNTWWLNYLHFTDQEREGKRPLLFHRWGGLGNHRYQIGFSGDTVSVWPSLAFQPWFTATAANVGYAYWSHDIGGHMPGVVTPELYTRWIQFGAFSPILRTHTTQNPDAERRVWAYPEPYSNIMRHTLQLRMALQPYLYTEARRTYDTGVAFLHPLYYDWPNANAAYTNKGEYVFGSQMIVDPVTKPVDSATQLAQQSVWIPSGEWIERATGKRFTGPLETTRSFSISQIPVYLRAGAIVPMQPPMLYTGEKPVDPLILNIYPLDDHQTSAYKLYSDASDSRAYERGICTWTPITASQNGDRLTVKIAPVEGHYPGMITERAYELRLPAGWPPELVTVNGKALSFAGNDSAKTGWRYDGNTLTTIITTPRYSVHTPVNIEVRRASGSLAARAQLDGFAGSIERLREAYDTLNSLFPYTRPSDPLIKALQTGDRISYRPDSARAELSAFSQSYAQALATVQSLADAANIPLDQLNQRLERNTGYGTTSSPAANYKLLVDRALAMLKDGQPGSAPE
ncbi:MAG TPA: TIM-barrel domain-containing protein [Acidobacteriaceae bacterium]|nr:TIM-barrel domain-containing protein [Acidobacteriaceae bacterium]